MADSNLDGLTAILASSIDGANDVSIAWDDSETGAARTKKITFDELRTWATNTLQEAYGAGENITTTDTDGAVQLQRGTTGGDDDVVFEILNGAGTQKWSVRGDGQVTSSYTATASDQRAVKVTVDADGNGDVTAHDIVYSTGATGSNADEAVNLVNVDESDSLGGEVAAHEVLSTNEGSANVTALLAGATIDPLKQLSGTFGNADTILDNAADVTTALSSGGAGNITILDADTDTFTVSSAFKFEEMELIFDTPETGFLFLGFEHSTGVDTWGTFFPTDGTNSMTNNGVISWLDSNIPSWAVGAGGEYLIRITRDLSFAAINPIVDLVQISAVVEYGWDKNGDLTVNNINGVNPSYESLTVALGDTTSDITTGTTKAYWDATYDGTINNVGASLLAANTGSVATFDINKNTVTILSTKITIDATETNSRTAATPPVISVSSFVAGDRFEFDIDTVGATVAGAGPNVYLDITRT